MKLLINPCGYARERASDLYASLDGRSSCSLERYREWYDEEILREKDFLPHRITEALKPENISTAIAVQEDAGRGQPDGKWSFNIAMLWEDFGRIVWDTPAPGQPPLPPAPGMPQ